MNIDDLSVRQVANALVIFAAAQPFGPDATKAALMTAAAESSYLRFANDGTYNRDGKEQIWRWYGQRFGGPNLTLDQCRTIYREHMRVSLTLPNDRVAGEALTTKDSVGHFQQREMYGYGPLVDLCDPTKATLIFVRGVPGAPLRVRHWLRADRPKGLTIAQACQWIQGSEFPTGENYAPMELVADQLIAHFGGFPEEKDGIAMASLDDLTKIVKDNAGTPIADTAKAVQSVGADVDKLTEWTQGGYDGSSKEQTNLAGIWRRADNVQQMLVGGYQGSTTTAKNNVDAIYWMLLNLCTALIPNVKHPDRAPNDQADPAPAADVQS